MHLKHCLLYCMVFSAVYAQTEYSEKELAALITTERKALHAQENLLQQPLDNENVKRSIEKTIVRIKQRIAELEKAKKA